MKPCDGKVDRKLTGGLRIIEFLFRGICAAWLLAVFLLSFLLFLTEVLHVSNSDPFWKVALAGCTFLTGGLAVSWVYQLLEARTHAWLLRVSDGGRAETLPPPGS